MRKKREREKKVSLSASLNSLCFSNLFKNTLKTTKEKEDLIWLVNIVEKKKIVNI